MPLRTNSLVTCCCSCACERFDYITWAFSGSGDFAYSVGDVTEPFTFSFDYTNDSDIVYDQSVGPGCDTFFHTVPENSFPTEDEVDCIYDLKADDLDHCFVVSVDFSIPQVPPTGPVTETVDLKVKVNVALNCYGNGVASIEWIFDPASPISTYDDEFYPFVGGLQEMEIDVVDWVGSGTLVGNDPAADDTTGTIELAFSISFHNV